MLFLPLIKRDFPSYYQSLPLSPIRRGLLKWVPVIGFGFPKCHIHTDEESFFSRAPAFVPFLTERVSHKDTLDSSGVLFPNCWPMVPDESRTSKHLWWYDKLHGS